MSGDMCESERNNPAPDYLPQFNLKNVTTPAQSGQFAINSVTHNSNSNTRPVASPVPVKVLRLIMDYWLANGVISTIPIPQLKNRVLEYYLEFGEWPGPASFDSANASRIQAALATTASAANARVNPETATAQQVMAGVLLPTPKVANLDEVAATTCYPNQQAIASTSTSPSQTTVTKSKQRSLKRTGFDYLASEYGEAARKLLAERPGLARYLGVNAEKLLAIVLAWCNHVLFREMGERKGRYMSLGIDRFAREAGLTTRSVQLGLKALQQAQLIETTLAGLTLGQTEATRRIPIPADELFALKADCQRLTVEQGGGTQGYLQPRCWQFHNQVGTGKSKSKATGNVFYLLKKDVWEAEIVRQLRPFNPFQSLTAQAQAQKQSQGIVLLDAASEELPEKRTLGSASLPVAGRPQKDVTTEERTLIFSSTGVGKDVNMAENEANQTTKGRFNYLMREKYTKKDVKRTSPTFTTSSSRPHESVSVLNHEYIKEPSIKAKVNPVQVPERLSINNSSSILNNPTEPALAANQPFPASQTGENTSYASYPLTNQEGVEQMGREVTSSLPEQIATHKSEGEDTLAEPTLETAQRVADQSSAAPTTALKPAQPQVHQQQHQAGEATPRRKQYFSQLSDTEKIGMALLRFAHQQMPDYTGDPMERETCIQFAQLHTPQVLTQEIAEVARLKACLVNAPNPIKNPIGFLSKRLKRLAPSMLDGLPIATEPALAPVPSETEQARLSALAAAYYQQHQLPATGAGQGQEVSQPPQFDITNTNQATNLPTRGAGLQSSRNTSFRNRKEYPTYDRANQQSAPGTGKPTKTASNPASPARPTSSHPGPHSGNFSPNPNGAAGAGTGTGAGGGGGASPLGRNESYPASPRSQDGSNPPASPFRRNWPGAEQIKPGQPNKFARVPPPGFLVPASQVAGLIGLGKPAPVTNSGKPDPGTTDNSDQAGSAS